MPIKRVLDWDLVALRACWVDGAPSDGADLTEANPCDIGGQLTAIGSHYVSASKEIAHVNSLLQGHRPLFRLRSTMMQEEGQHGHRDVLAYTG